MLDGRRTTQLVYPRYFTPFTPLRHQTVMSIHHGAALVALLSFLGQMIVPSLLLKDPHMKMSPQGSLSAHSDVLEGLYRHDTTCLCQM